MKHADVLETEYKEHYNQYRWIGQMQAAVLTFYGVVTTFALLATAVLRPQPPAQMDYRWSAGVMIGLGSLGLLVGYGLFRSRTMQRRTALYLKCLLVQMASTVEDPAATTKSSLRFRSLCSTRGKFKLWDTMNIAILIALYSGEALLLTGLISISVFGNGMSASCAATVGLLGMLALVILTPVLVQTLLMNPEAKQIREEYLIAERISTVEEMQKHLGLPEAATLPKHGAPPPA